MPHRQQRGVALVLVLWLVAAMSITVAGAMALSTEEVSVSSTRLTEAKLYALGKGVARMAIVDRQRSMQSNLSTEESGLQPFTGTVFTNTYSMEGFALEASVYPASGFVSLSETDTEVWVTLLTGLGGLDDATARTIADRLIDADMTAMGSLGGAAGSFGAVRAAAQFGASGRTRYVEQLLGIEGMTRETYDRVRRSVSPFGSMGEVSPEDAPPELSGLFSQEGVEPVSSEGNGQTADGNFCVEITARISESEVFSQRIWVQSSAMADSGGIKLVRIERPTQANQLGAG